MKDILGLETAATSHTVDFAVQNTQNILRLLATSPDFAAKMGVAFGNSWDVEKAEGLAKNWASGDFSDFPRIEIRRSAEINGARGAFAAATNAIYLSQELASEGDVGAIASVLLEEYGHYIDSQVNSGDAPGDEGEIFAAIAQGKVLSQAEISALKVEDDGAIAFLDGEEVAIEQAEMTTKKDTLKFLAGKIDNWTTAGSSNRFEKELFNIEIKAPGGTVDNAFLKYDWGLESTLKASIFATAGNYGEAKFNYPIDLAVELPKQVDKGENFSIIPGVGVKNSSASFDSQASRGFELPNAGLSLEENLNKAEFKNITIKNPFGEPFKPNVGVESSLGSGKLEFDVLSYINGELPFPGDLGTISASLPKIEKGKITSSTPRDNTDPLLPDIAASGKSESILKIEADLDKIFALSFPPLAVLGNEIEISGPSERIKAKLSYDLLDIKTNLGIGFQQDFTFDPEKVAVIMSVDGQPEQRGVLGSQENKFEFQAPSQGSGLIKVKAKYQLSGQVKNNIGPIIQGSIDAKALQAGASFQIYKLAGSVQLGPLLSLKLPDGGFATDPLPLIGSPSTKPSDPDPLFKILPVISLDGKNDPQNSNQDLEIEVEYEIPYNLPFSISDSRISEGNSGTQDMVFTVSRREASDKSVTLSYTSSKGSGTVTIAAGQTSADIKIPVVGDTQKEPTETFTVTLQNSDGTPFAEGVPTLEATGIIIDDDGKPEPPKEPRSNSHGEPHLINFDGLSFDFQAVGEFTLVKSASGDLNIQVRQQPIRPEVSVNKAVATVIGGKRIALYTTEQGNPPLKIDGNSTEIAEGDSIAVGDGRIYLEGNTYSIVYANGDQLIAEVYGNHINFDVHLSPGREGLVTGLLGNNNKNPDDDIVLRDGTVLTQPVPFRELYREFGESWRITQAESLFDYKPGENTETITDRNFPASIVTIDDLNPADRKRAEEIVDAAGITDPILRANAILDIGLTGDATFLQGALKAKTPGEALIIAIPTSAVDDFTSTTANTIAIPTSAVDDFTSTTANTPVTTDVLINDSATIGVPLSISNFDPSTTAGGNIKLDDNGTPNDKSDDKLTYTPPANFTGTDTFNYTLSDGTQTSSAKVTVTVPDFNLSNLNGSNGFVIKDSEAGSFSGVSVNKVGDFNGDKIDDIIVGAFGADPNGNNAAGKSYVIFGSSAGFSASLDPSTLNGSNGFVLNGIDAEGFSGGSVSGAGDINGDGFDDVIIGAFGAAVDGKNNAGKTYVVFGSNGGFPALNLSELNGNNGFVLNGTNEFDYLGLAVSKAGDLNDDGFDDLLVSAPGALGGASSKSCVIFGRSGGFSASLNLADIKGDRGFVINDTNGFSGTSVSQAGDINGDGIDDIIIGAEASETDSNTIPSESYVVFGSSESFPDSFNLAELNGKNGFVLTGIDSKSGTSVSKAGDINGDGFDDFAIAISATDNSAGKSYIVCGSNQDFSANLDVSKLNGRNGFVVYNGIDGNSVSSVSSAGDINADGFDDLIVGVSQAVVNDKFAAGKSYLIFGNNGGFSPTLNLSKLDGNNGLALNGVEIEDLSGTAVSEGGDVNGDGIDDLIVGTPGSLFNNSAGKSYVVFGSNNFGKNDSSNPAKFLFDAKFYASNNPDLQGVLGDREFRNAFEHFSKFGFAEGRAPSSFFASDYLTNNPDVAAAVANKNFRSGFEHFIKFGFAENRQPNLILASFASLDDFYRAENSDVDADVKQGKFSSGLEHLIRFGMVEGREVFPHFSAVSETFDSDFYLAENSDVEDAIARGVFRNGLEHFINFGMVEGRNPGSQFDNSAYLANNPDVADAVSQGMFRSGFEHFMEFGFGEDRKDQAIATEFFDTSLPLATEENDTLTGSSDNDFLIGDAGDNFLSGDFGNDTLTGDTGRDVFVLQQGRGSDVIIDFEDSIDSLGLAEGLSFEQLVITQSDGATLISLNDELLTSLTGVEASSIGSQDFTLI